MEIAGLITLSFILGFLSGRFLFREQPTDPAKTVCELLEMNMQLTEKLANVQRINRDIPVVEANDERREYPELSGGNI